MSNTKSDDSSQTSDGVESFVHVNVNAMTDMEVDAVQNRKPLDLKITPRHDTIGLQDKHAETHFCATVTAQSLPEDDDSMRAPVDIIIALDVSTSMRGRKLELCKETVALLLRELGVRDSFGLVTFGNEAEVQIPMRKLTTNGKAHAINKVKKLSTAGCTNLSGGIGLAAQELQSLECPNKVQSIFLLTDGLANRGVSDHAGILQLTKGCLISGKDLAPVAIHCFGYGTDHDREMLRDVSEVTEGGSYFFVENDSEVSSAFGNALGGILSVVAQNTVLTFRASDEYNIRIINVLHNKSIKQEDGSFTVSVGDFYAEESRDVVCTVALASGLFGEKPLPHVSVSMTYMDTVNKKLEKCEAIEGSISRPQNDEVSPPNHHVALQYIRVVTTNTIADAEKIAATGNLDAAKAKISAAIEYLSRESVAFGDVEPNSFIIQLLSELNDMLSGLSSRASWDSGGAYKMQKSRLKHMQQRSCESSARVACVYRSPNKAKYSSKFSST